MALTPRDAYLRRTYGITEADFLEILDYQNGKCSICRRPPKPGVNLHVDHDHRTGVVRGLLCMPCNHDLLGRRDKDPMLFFRAYEYLLHPPAAQVLKPGRTVPVRKRPKRGLKK